MLVYQMVPCEWAGNHVESPWKDGLRQASVQYPLPKRTSAQDAPKFHEMSRSWFTRMYLAAVLYLLTYRSYEKWPSSKKVKLHSLGDIEQLIEPEWAWGCVCTYYIITLNWTYMFPAHACHVCIHYTFELFLSMFRNTRTLPCNWFICSQLRHLLLCSHSCSAQCQGFLFLTATFKTFIEFRGCCSWEPALIYDSEPMDCFKLKSLGFAS